MAKRWKKIKNGWKNGLTTILIVKYNIGRRNMYEVVIIGDMGWTSQHLINQSGLFKTKALAIRHAKRWMRKHPKG